MNILLCHSQPDFRASLRRRLEDEFPRLMIDEVSNEAAALKKARNHKNRPYKFLITSLDLASNPDSPIDQEHRGLAVVKEANEHGAKVHCIVIVPGEVRPEVAALFGGVSCLRVTEDIDTFGKIIHTIKSILSSKGIRPRLSLKFVQDPNSSNWNFWLDGDIALGLQERRGAFPIRPYFIKALAKRSSETFSTREDWLGRLGEIGRELYTHFFDQENTFSKLFKNALKNAGGTDRVRLSFDIQRDCYSLAIEALVPPEEDGASKTLARDLPFWMLKVPIYRSVSFQNPSRTLGEQARPHLFINKNEPINCLIIQAEASGKIRIPGSNIRVPFNPILFVSDECERLKKQLKAKEKQWSIGDIKIVPDKKSHKSFKEQLSECLAEDKWHLVHFCGHSHYRRPSGKQPGTGYLLLPGKPHELIDAHSFAHRLQKTQFLFLSSCESSEEAFAFEIARSGIPAVLGFRGGVDDSDVPDFVEIFYERLFSSRSIESAFVATRRKVRRLSGIENPLWASPVLVLVPPENTRQKTGGEGAASAA